MKTLDKRIEHLMQEEELSQYYDASLKNLPDCGDKCEYVDIALLMSQIPLRSNKGNPKNEMQGNAE